MVEERDSDKASQSSEDVSNLTFGEQPEAGTAYQHKVTQYKEQAKNQEADAKSTAEETKSEKDKFIAENNEKLRRAEQIRQQEADA